MTTPAVTREQTAQRTAWQRLWQILLAPPIEEEAGRCNQPAANISQPGEAATDIQSEFSTDRPRPGATL